MSTTPSQSKPRLELALGWVIAYVDDPAQASAFYAEFGPFITGRAAPLDEVLREVGITHLSPCLPLLDYIPVPSSHPPISTTGFCRRGRFSDHVGHAIRKDSP